MTDTAISSAGDRTKWFYAWMAVTCLAVAVIGFLPTFFMPLVQGAFVRSPVFYIHGLLFFSWTLFFCAQTWLVASGKVLAHREWGVLGAALAGMMAFSVMVVVNVRLNQNPPIPAGPGSASFAWIDVSALLYFGTSLTLGFINTRRPETHKRLMLLATMSLLNAPAARWFGVLFAPPPDAPPGPPPFFVEQGGNIVIWLLMLVPIIFDWRTRGKVSLVYLIGLPVYILYCLSWDPIGFSPQWLAVADWLKHLPG